jgi:2-polyprenyl-3-methyl-5-hydroxy-6-metoxy-1,4-benzoquinol methylase
MKFSRKKVTKRLPPLIYDTPYFLSHCGGFEEYLRSMGAKLDTRLKIVLDLAKIDKETKVLDIGCGRGEILLHVAKKGAISYGIDYSRDAIAISHNTIRGFNGSFKGNAHLCMAEATFIPFRSGSFDRIILSDIVEHLFPDELKKVMEEVSRLIKKGGLLVIHTFPNRWFYDIYYPLLRAFYFIFQRKRWPLNPRTSYERKMHINEQSPLSLILRIIRDFKPSIWVCHRDQMKEAIKRGRLPGSNPISFFKGPEIWAVGIKR